MRQALGVRDTPTRREQLALAYGNRAVSRLQAGNQYGARQDLQEAVKYNPSDPDFRSLLSRL